MPASRPDPQPEAAPTQEPVPNYYPDGKSHVRPVLRAILAPLNKALVNLTYRVEIEGLENLPQSGPHLLAPTHQSTADPALAASFVPRDVRFMAAAEQFQGVQGLLMRWMGAYPVDRENPSPVTTRHSAELLREGRMLGIFPEGGIPPEEEFHRVPTLKDGPARIGMMGKAESIIPITIHYRPDTRARPVEQLTAVAAGVLVSAAGIAAASGGGALGTVVGSAAGALAGGWIGAAVARRGVETTWCHPLPRLAAGLKGAALGAAAGGLATGLGMHFFPAAAPAIGWAASLAGGPAAAAAALGYSGRDVAHVVIGKPILFKDYTGLKKHEAAAQMTQALYRELSTTKERLAQI